jgi:nicotinamide-nucleotide amidase
MRGRGLTLVTAESCTGGLVAKLLTDVAGCSDVLWGAFVTYSNDAKMKCLGVPEGTLRRYGAVSAQTVRAMARGALAVSGASAAIAVSGVAGPGGGGKRTPVGLVWIGLRLATGECAERSYAFPPPRQRVRVLAAGTALYLMESLVSRGPEALDIPPPREYI